MQMPVIVGIILAVIFLVSFSEWFYHMVIGWEVLVLDDALYRYRIGFVVLISLMTFGATFYLMALINECPEAERTGPLAGLNCAPYHAIKAGTETVFAAEKNFVKN